MKFPFVRPVFALLPLVLSGACSAEPATPAAQPPFRVIEGVQQLTIVEAEAGLAATLFDPNGKELITLITDEFGQAHFAYIPNEPTTYQTGEGGDLPSYDGATLKPGTGYTFRTEEGTYGPYRVLGIDDHPPVALYEKQSLGRGMNYIETRDGTLLSAAVWIPDPLLCGDGPWPTIVEYSGYSPSNPREAQPGSMIANLMLCYVAVGVNMRGTGCSGGVFDVFNPAQSADAYDIIEVAGRQWFTLHNKVGMVGLSYPGITQLYAAATNPPHLAAIAPQSVIEDPWRQAWPGGIYNSGFTRQWIEARDRYAEAGGGDWVRKRIDEGDTVCEANQQLRSQNVNFKVFSESLDTFPPDAGERRLSNLVPRIDVPVFLTGAWQDEQTGSRFATMLDDFENAPVKRFTMFNGRHPDGYLPLTLTRWAEFLEFYVARRIPVISPILRVAQEDLFAAIFDADGLRFEPDRFLYFPDYESALAAYEAEPPVRILFESGYGSDVTEAPVARFERSFASWPPSAEAKTWYLGPDGTLTDGAPASLPVGDDGLDHYRHDPEAGDQSYIYHDSLFRLGWDWPYAGAGYALAYTTAPFAEDTLIVGNGGYVDLWFASTASEAHVEVNILEVRPDGTEFLVQNGVFDLRFRNGVDEARSGEFLVEYTYAADSVAELVPGEYVNARIPIRPFGHAFRKGTRLRLEIDTPGRDHGFWEYENPAYGDEVIHTVARTPARPTSLKLPLITGTDIPDEAPPCYSLRGIVCRDWMPLPNTTVTLD